MISFHYINFNSFYFVFLKYKKETKKMYQKILTHLALIIAGSLLTMLLSQLSISCNTEISKDQQKIKQESR